MDQSSFSRAPVTSWKMLIAYLTKIKTCTLETNYRSLIFEGRPIVRRRLKEIYESVFEKIAVKYFDLKKQNCVFCQCICRSFNSLEAFNLYKIQAEVWIATKYWIKETKTKSLTSFQVILLQRHVPALRLFWEFIVYNKLWSQKIKKKGICLKTCQDVALGCLHEKT